MCRYGLQLEKYTLFLPGNLHVRDSTMDSFAVTKTTMGSDKGQNKVMRSWRNSYVNVHFSVM